MRAGDAEAGDTGLSSRLDELLLGGGEGRVAEAVGGVDLNRRWRHDADDRHGASVHPTALEMLAVVQEIGETAVRKALGLGVLNGAGHRIRIDGSGPGSDESGQAHVEDLRQGENNGSAR